jgi:allantoin racemase
MRVRVIAPVLHSKELVEKTRAEYEAAAGAGVDVSVVCLANGTRSIESELDVALAQPETIRLVREAERDAVQACIIACFSDPGGAAAKESVGIPVVGEGEAALHFAHLLGYRYSVITTRQVCVPRVRNVALRAGLGERLASVRAAGFGVMDLSSECIPRVVEQAVHAVHDDGAHVIVLGCTGTAVEMAYHVETRLAEAVGTYVPVIDPVKTALKLAEALVEMGMRPSKLAYPPPPVSRPEYQFATPSPA